MPKKKKNTKKKSEKKKNKKTKKSEKTTSKKSAEKTPNNYQINVDKAIAKVKIIEKQGEISYNLNLPSFGKGTSALLNEIRDEIIVRGEFRAEELNDLEESIKIKSKFQERANEMIEKKIPGVSEDIRNTLSGFLMQEMLGLGE